MRTSTLFSLCTLATISFAAAHNCRAGGEMVSQSRQPVRAPLTYSYNFCMNCPCNNGPGQMGCTPQGMTHYAPRNYPYGAYSHAGYGPGPFVVPGMVGLAVGYAVLY